jgi:hypothetical protein
VVSLALCAPDDGVKAEAAEEICGRGDVRVAGPFLIQDVFAPSESVVAVELLSSVDVGGRRDQQLWSLAARPEDRRNRGRQCLRPRGYREQAAQGSQPTSVVASVSGQGRGSIPATSARMSA